MTGSPAPQVLKRRVPRRRPVWVKNPPLHPQRYRPRVSTAPGKPPATAQGQGQGQAAKGGQVIRPVAAEMKVPAVEALDPKMWKVLQDWELATKDIKALYAEHQRFVYDQTFAVEKRGEGKVWYESPDHGRYEVDPSSVKGQVARKLGTDGKPYSLQPHEPEKWICTGAEIIKVDDTKKEFERIVIPPEDRGMNMMNGPLPFIIGMKAEQARRRYFLQLLKHENGEYWVHAKPRDQRDATLWSDAIVILDEKTYLPRAVQLTDPTGNQTTTHTFKKMDPRTKEFARTGFPAWIAGGNPFAFNDKGYKEVDLGNPPPQNAAAPPRIRKRRSPRWASVAVPRRSSRNLRAAVRNASPTDLVSLRMTHPCRAIPAENSCSRGNSLLAERTCGG